MNTRSLLFANLAVFGLACATPDAAETPPEDWSNSSSAERPPPDTPLVLSVSPLVAGGTASWIAADADPGETVIFLRGGALGDGPCADGGTCLDITGGVERLGTATADGTGVATLNMDLPDVLPTGMDAAFQAVAIRGVDGIDSVTSNAVSRLTEDAVLDWTLTNNDFCTPGPRIVPLPWEVGHYAANRLTPPAWPFIVDSISYELDEQSGCRGDVDHTVLVWAESSLIPSATPVLLETIHVPAGGVAVGTARTYDVPLSSPLELDAGEHLFVAIEMVLSDSGEFTCLTTCGGHSDPEAGFWSNDTATPFPWTTLSSFGLDGDYKIDAHGSVDRLLVELSCDDGMDGDADGLVDCDDDNCEADLACLTCLEPDADLGGGLGLVVADNTGLPAQWDPSCTSTDYQILYSWTAPQDGRFRFDTNASVINDSTLVILDSCGVSELACNDDGGDGLLSLTELDLLEGEEILIGLGGFGAEMGEIGLSIELLETTCDDLADDDVDGLVDCDDPDCVDDAACFVCLDPEGDLSSSLGSAVLLTNNAGGEALAGDDCLASDYQQAWTWTAPSSATFRFDTIGSGLGDTTLVVTDDCGDVTLACNDDFDAPSSYQSLVEVPLAAGETVLVVVGGFANQIGDIQLNITEL